MVGNIDIEHLYTLYHSDIYQFSLYFTNSTQDAEDITHDTFMKALKSMNTLNDQSRAKYWLLSIARHTAIDHIRKKKFSSLLPDIFETLKSKEASLDEQVILKEKWEEIQQVLLKVKPHYRSLVILRGINDFNIKETALILGCTELKVRVDFHRAVKQLRKHLSKEEGAVLNYEQERKFNSRD